MNICDKTVFISKSMVMQQKHTFQWICLKQIILEFAQALAGQLLRQKHASLSIGDAAKKRMLQSRTSKYDFCFSTIAVFSPFTIELNVTNGTSFWTSGSSDKCPNSYGWCGTDEKEFIDYQLLGLDPFQSAGGKECVSATLDKSKLVLQADSCATKMRYICEVKSQLNF
jgi:hypothetical protein